MELRRFFVDETCCFGDKIIISGDEFLHLKNVLRMKVGYKIIVCLNDGIDRYCTIETINSNDAECKIESVVLREVKSHSVTLYPALLKNNKLDFVVQKAVELGVDKIIPFLSNNTNETKFNLERANKIALEAAKQCGSATLTKVLPLVDFDTVLSELLTYDNVVMPYEAEKQVSFKEATHTGSSHAIIIGSEGGFTSLEVEKAQESGAQIVTLGKRILRADTASIVSVALLMNELGELSQ